MERIKWGRNPPINLKTKYIKILIFSLLLSLNIKAQSFFLSDTVIYGDTRTQEILSMRLKTTLFEFYILDNEIRIISNHIVNIYQIESINDGEIVDNGVVKFKCPTFTLFLFRSPKQIIIIKGDESEIYKYYKSF